MLRRFRRRFYSFRRCLISPGAATSQKSCANWYHCNKTCLFYKENRYIVTYSEEFLREVFEFFNLSGIELCVYVCMFVRHQLRDTPLTARRLQRPLQPYIFWKLMMKKSPENTIQRQRHRQGAQHPTFEIMMTHLFQIWW